MIWLYVNKETCLFKLPISLQHSVNLMRHGSVKVSGVQWEEEPDRKHTKPEKGKNNKKASTWWWEPPGPRASSSLKTTQGRIAPPYNPGSPSHENFLCTNTIIQISLLMLEEKCCCHKIHLMCVVKTWLFNVPRLAPAMQVCCPGMWKTHTHRKEEIITLQCLRFYTSGLTTTITNAVTATAGSLKTSPACFDQAYNHRNVYTRLGFNKKNRLYVVKWSACVFLVALTDTDWPMRLL